MNPNKPPEINPENLEEFLLLYLDGELSEAQKTAVEAYLNVHPEARKTLEEFKAVVLMPDEATVYEGKENLYRTEALPTQKSKAFSFKPMLYAAAAVLALWAGIHILNRPAPVKMAAQKPAPLRVPTPETTSSAKPAFTQAAKPSTAISTQSQNRLPAEKAVAQKPKKPIENLPPRKAIEEIAPLPLLILRHEPDWLPEPETAVVVVVESIYPPKTLPAAQPSLAIDIPLLRDVHGAAKDRIQQLRTVHQNLRNTEATLVLANRELLRIRF